MDSNFVGGDVVSMAGPAKAQAAQAEMPISPAALSALGYFCGVAAIVALCVKPYQQMKQSRFHAVQALLFQVSWAVGYLAILTVMGIFGLVVSTILGALKLYSILGVMLMLGPIISGVFSLAMLVAWITLIVAAATGKDIRLPVLGQMAAKFSA